MASPLKGRTRPAMPGAGRPKGSKSKATMEREVLLLEHRDKLIKNGASPLEIMLGAARAVWKEANKNPHKPDLALATQAAGLAEKAAPYVHGKIAQIVDRSGDEDESGVTKIVIVNSPRRAVAEPDS